MGKQLFKLRMFRGSGPFLFAHCYSPALECERRAGGWLDKEALKQLRNSRRLAKKGLWNRRQSWLFVFETVTLTPSQYSNLSRGHILSPSPAVFLCTVCQPIQPAALCITCIWERVWQLNLSKHPSPGAVLWAFVT